MTAAVLDASVVVAALLDSGELGAWAEACVAEHDLVAPHLMMVEASNQLRRGVLTRAVATAEGTAAHRDLVRIPMELFPFAPFAARVWELRDTVTAYDAWYVALAEWLGCTLYTLDTRLARASGTRCAISCFGLTR